MRAWPRVVTLSGSESVPLVVATNRPDWAPSWFIEEEDPVPAHTVTEATFTATSAAAIQADASPRTPPTNRYRVRLVNTHASVRVYVGTTASGAGAPTLDNTCPVVEADFGIWEDWLDPNVAIWCKSTGADVTVRIVQYATT